MKKIRQIINTNHFSFKKVKINHRQQIEDLTLYVPGQKKVN
jgi:hypothetical protein